jgi:hypothetical protein
MDAFTKNKDLITLSATVLLALAGFLAKYLNDLVIARRRDRLERINSQLKLLYGPLFALTQASGKAWIAFRQEHRPGTPFFNKLHPPNEEELKAWRLWMIKTFMPINRRMVDVVVGNSDMLEGDMPPVFLDLVAHVAAYETILAQWETKDYRTHVAKVPFPAQIESVVLDAYQRLRHSHARLLK